MQMRERGRQRGEIYSRHENGASVSEIRSVVGGFLQDLVQQCISFLSARIIDKRKFLSCFRGPFERKRKVGDERSATLFGTVHSQWCGQLDVIRDLWLRGREKLDSQPSKTLPLARLSDESLLHATICHGFLLWYDSCVLVYVNETRWNIVNIDAMHGTRAPSGGIP